MGWNGQQDSSLRCRTGFKSVEVVSPILAGEAGLTEVFYMAQYLQEAGAEFNSSTGLHVHVSADHLSETQKKRLAKLFRQYEGVFMAVSGENIGNRVNNGYCKLAHLWRRLVDYHDRYRSLNFATGGKGTVEFRLFQATIEPAALVTAVYMCVGLVAYVSQMSDEELGPVDPIPSLWSLFGTGCF